MDQSIEDYIFATFITTITINPRTTLVPNPINTFFPYVFSPKRYAIDAFTVLFDITAMSIVVAAINAGISPIFAPSATVRLIASTSASHENIPSP